MTGGAGYIGSVLCGRLLDAGNTVTVIDNLTHGVPSLLHLCSRPGFEFVRGDVRDLDLMRRKLRPADVVIPLAAVVGAPACDRDPDLAWAINLHAIEGLCRRHLSPDQLLIFPTTNSGYGVGARDVPCTEDSPLNPVSLYGRSKVEAEEIVLERPNSISLRLATVFGCSSRMRWDLLVNSFVYAALDPGYLVLFEGGHRRNYIHIADVADCLVHCLDSGNAMVGRAYNVGNDEANCTKRELAELVRAQVSSLYVHEAPVGKDPDQRDYVVSNQRLRETGFEARRSLEDGIAELVKGYRMQG